MTRPSADSEVLVYNPREFSAAVVRAREAPLDLTAHDICVLREFGDPALLDKAYRARQQALAAPPQAPARGPIDEATADAFADAVVALINARVDPILARIAALEARPVVKHCGIYRDDVLYRENSLVTRSGGMWHAQRDTQDVPGTDGSGWQLVVKAGKA
jgi:hypothetical protein